jgi:hypothetical protein
LLYIERTDDTVPRSKRLRLDAYLRLILAAFGLTSLLISALIWLLDYLGLFCFSIYSIQYQATVNSYRGRFSLVVSKEPPNSQPDQSWSMAILPKNEEHNKEFASRPTFRFARRHNVPQLIFAPSWTPTALSLLITTTIAALRFGAIAWSIHANGRAN